MANIKVTDQELRSILTELESELSAALSGTSLAKAEGDEPEDSGDDKKKAPPKEGGDEGGSSGPPPAAEGSDAPPADGGGGGDMPPPPGADAPPPGGPSAGPAAPDAPVSPAGAPPAAPPPGAPMGDPAAAAAPAPAAPADPAMLQAEYSQLPPEELKAHYLAAKAALFAVMGGGAAPSPGMGAGAPPAGIPPAGGPPGAGAMPPPAAPPPPPAAAMPPPGAPPVPPVMKGEKMPTDANGKLPGTPTTPNLIAKSEKDELAALKATLETMTKALTLIAGVPMQKAVTDLTYVAKSEDGVKEVQLSPAQIKAKLNEIARNPLTKNEDRNLMNKYVCGSVDVNAISHLLK